ncbi:MAG: HEPN domain-containing protein [Chloroflexi bacterium]|nr:HEPN domain-containing protein [Chloroflexota bacterium]
MNRSDLQRLSQLRVREARVLLDNGFYAGAYYLLGYAVECAIKACIAKQVRRYDFPDRGLANDSYTHDLDRLMKVAELTTQFQNDARNNPTLSLNWTIVKEWSEQYRYNDNITEEDARYLYSAITARKDGILAWLKRLW